MDNGKAEKRWRTHKCIFGDVARELEKIEDGGYEVFDLVYLGRQDNDDIMIVAKKV